MPSHKRLFSTRELDLLMEGPAIGANEEKEEYDKVFEERLYRLDEVELRHRFKSMEAVPRGLKLDEMSTPLAILMETLARTRESSPDELSTPEYWLAWFRKTLAGSRGSKRANRTFRERQSYADKTPRVGLVHSPASDERDVGGGISVIRAEVEHSVNVR
ncbi:hypothetical protein PC123_g4163 [Phytophthora cactorum]|nr:hypothetical protein PC120_g5280 [Phytophthora cactorum]KAG4060977.1 hypothetical protein PC123_g4163 [Phytophthora cactorum]